MIQLMQFNPQEVKRMSEKQYKEACSLIRNLCCNYERSTGGCLLLEVRGGKALKADITGAGAYRVKKCTVCGQPFRAVSNRAKYCARCSKKIERERKAAWAQKTRARVDVSSF